MSPPRKRKAREAAEKQLKATVAAGGHEIPVSEAETRIAIKAAFKQLFTPPRSEWHNRGDGTIAQIYRQTGYKRSAIEDVLERVQAGLDVGVDVDVSGRLATPYYYFFKFYNSSAYRRVHFLLQA